MKGVAQRAGNTRYQTMNRVEEAVVNNLLTNYPAIGCKALVKPFVLVLKTATGTTVIFQRQGLQNSTSVGANVFGKDACVEVIFDVERANCKHVLALVVGDYGADGKTTNTKRFFTIGLKGEQTEYVTAFFAYEAQPGKSVHCISIIEDADGKTIYADAVRYGKNSAKLLKSQLRMYLALSGINPEIRENIVKGGGFLPPAFSNGMESDSNE